MGKILRRQTPSVNIGELKIGSSHAIAVQSMTDTPTADPEATFQQTLELIEAGSEMVRWTGGSRRTGGTMETPRSRQPRPAGRNFRREPRGDPDGQLYLRGHR